jgi:hypothetical protein
LHDRFARRSTPLAGSGWLMLRIRFADTKEVRILE